MAGHSKFKNIMHRKGAQDKKRSGMFSKLSREITVAAKMGLPDPDMNPRLRAAVPLQRGLRTVAPLSASVASPGRAGPPPAAPATDPEKYERAKKRKKAREDLALS